MEMKRRDHTKLLEPYNEGDDLELLCEVHGGDPRPRVTWYLENTVIDDSYEQRADGTTTNALTFPNVGRQHLNARLVCQASNTNLAPPLARVLILDVNLRPLTVQIQNKARQVSADRSHQVECKSSGSRPSALITWWKGSKQLKRSAKNFSENNATLSILTFTPTAEDHDKILTCRTENPRIPDFLLEDKWRLNVHYVPIATLKLGSNLNADGIKEGDDVYFECSVRANPKSHRLKWYKDGVEIYHNATGGVIPSDQSLVLQSVTRASSGDYGCVAANAEGRGTSNPVSLQVRYVPVCKEHPDGEVHGALKQETVLFHCNVDSSPPPSGFHWTFNNSGEQIELPISSHFQNGYSSTLRYTPVKDIEYGTIACWARNSVGQQETPCVFTLIAAGPPSPLQNCTVLNQSLDTLQVECTEGFDGGLHQEFYMQILELPLLKIIYNISTNHTPPFFEVHGLETSRSYKLSLFAANAKGRSDVVSLYTVALLPDKYTSESRALLMSPVLAAFAALAAALAAAVCGVLTALYRRHAARQRHCGDTAKHSLGDALYMERGAGSLSPASESPYPLPEVKCDKYPPALADDVDPDIIPCNYDKKSICSEYVRLQVPRYSPYDAGRPLEVATGQPKSLTKSFSSQSISRTNRGVTARGPEIALSTAARGRPEVVTTARQVRESCI
ncbi:Nephrin [Eumeta japonica]|uniref:Nephrin n=1 Tax=Eumeta variegata TaxID=151549 RepID=A0A4C1XR93_EUMVA|nr:Nephrin [Eumeta japonica]